MLISRTVSVSIYCDPQDAYTYIRTPANLARWASGLGSVTGEDHGVLHVETPSGAATLRFAPQNELGVLDHDVTTATGIVTHVPMRVLRNDDGCEVIITLFQPETMTEREFSRDVSWVRRDLESLKEALEA